MAEKKERVPGLPPAERKALEVEIRNAFMRIGYAEPRAAMHAQEILNTPRWRAAIIRMKDRPTFGNSLARFIVNYERIQAAEAAGITKKPTSAQKKRLKRETLAAEKKAIQILTEKLPQDRRLTRTQAKNLLAGYQWVVEGVRTSRLYGEKAPRINYQRLDGLARKYLKEHGLRTPKKPKKRRK